MNLSRFRLLLTLLVLAIPALAMILPDQVKWSFLDFCIMGMLIFALSVTILFIQRFLSNRKKWAYILFVTILFIILWAELGVGIFDSPIAGD